MLQTAMCRLADLVLLLGEHCWSARLLPLLLLLPPK